MLIIPLNTVWNVILLFFTQNISILAQILYRWTNSPKLDNPASLIWPQLNMFRVQLWKLIFVLLTLQCTKHPIIQLKV